MGQERKVTSVEAFHPTEYTYSADIVLADGRAVSIPDPGRDWELVETFKFDGDFRFVGARKGDVYVGGEHAGSSYTCHPIKHEGGLCWLSEMYVRVNEKITQGNVVKYPYIKQLRKWVRKPTPEIGSYTDSVLKVLW